MFEKGGEGLPSEARVHFNAVTPPRYIKEGDPHRFPHLIFHLFHRLGILKIGLPAGGRVKKFRGEGDEDEGTGMRLAESIHPLI